ncbi:recombinase family protein [Streptomyces sparsogenes]|uniref:recombinase family protein n=1 Tax=Streptomyces sparsogenes TaxID=67365 RepID=UPI0033F969A8
MSRTALLASATETAIEAGTFASRPQVRAIIYARVSSDPRQQLRSVSQQIDECKTECQRRGWTIVEIIPENDRSASRYAVKDRPKYRRLIEKLCSGDVDVLVTWESSRAQRDLEAYVKLRKIAEENGVQWCYKGRLYDLSRTDDRFTTGLDALLDERESSVTRDRILRDMRQHAAKGGAHGPTVYGYRRLYDPNTKVFVAQEIREDQAAIVREAARRVASGEALNAIVNDFNKRQIPTRGGAKRWRTNQVAQMVRTAAYIGKRTHHGKIIADAVWPAILDEETYYTCVQILGDPRRRTSRDGKVKHLLSGIARCGGCGGPMRRHASTQGQTRKAHYICIDCFRCSMRQHRLDDYITAVVCERLARPDAADLLGDDTRAEDAKAAMAEAAEKRARLDEFYDAAATGELSAAALARIESQLLPQIEAAEKRAKELRVPAVLREVIRPDIADYWPTLDITQQREVIRTLMEIRVAKTGRTGRKLDVGRVEIKWKHMQSSDE